MYAYYIQVIINIIYLFSNTCAKSAHFNIHSNKTTMKKLVFGALSMVFFSATLVSCGGGISEEEIAKKAEEMLKAEQASLMEEANAKCEEIISAKLDSIHTAMAEMEEEMEEE